MLNMLQYVLKLALIHFCSATGEVSVTIPTTVETAQNPTLWKEQSLWASQLESISTEQKADQHDADKTEKNGSLKYT